MRIGITNLFRGSAFSGATPQVALYIARELIALGHEVEFIVPVDSQDWFVDCASVATIPVIKLENGKTLKTYNLVLEVVWFLPPGMRRQLSQKTAMFYHYPAVFYDIESSVYPLNLAVRNFENVDAIWTWSHFKATDYAYLEFLSRKPVFTCPFIWNPVLIDSYVTEGQVPEWKRSGPLKIAICESNESNTSQCTIPLTICSEIYRQVGPCKWTVLNSEVLASRPFFMTNIVKNLHLGDGDLSGNFLKRVRLPDLRRESNVIISHQRWRPIKYMLLDALWLGIPLIHNSEMIKELPGGSLFYEFNRIGQAVDCWKRLDSTASNIAETRAAILAKWGPGHAGSALNDMIQKTFTYVKPPPVMKPSVRVAFMDMWADFNPTHNMFMANLEQRGIMAEVNQNDPNVIICGPFGADHTQPRFGSVPKIFYTGENVGPRASAALNIGFSRGIADKYIRLPNWMLELNWFNTDVKQYRNPEPFALDTLKPVVSVRSKFCAFVASNPSCEQRNTLYNVVSRYKKVDSAGVLFNNMTQIPCGPGGSGGQKAKVEFYKQYKFALVCENSSSPGYITEKILHAKMGGCIPIYWGAADIGEEFNPKSFINANALTQHELLMAIKTLDTDASAWASMAAEPLLSEAQIKERKALWDTVADAMATLVKAPIATPPPLVAQAAAAPAVAAGPTVTQAPSVDGVAAAIASFGPPGPVPALAPVPAATPVPAQENLPLFQTKSIVSEGIPPYKSEIIGDVGSRVIVTCCNKNFVQSAKRLIESSPVPVYVWVWDVSADDKILLEQAGAKKVTPFDTTWNPKWPDFWNPAYYAWKSLVLVLASTTFTKGTQVLYLDSGIDIAAPLDNVWSALQKDEFFACEMKEHKMRTWSHPKFCELLRLTEDELNAPQYSANICGFIAGGKYAPMLTEALTYASRPEIISGHKWFQYSNTCFGHRHDQSILSLVGFRNKIVAHDLDSFAGHVSMDNCRQTGRPFYVHRQIWKPVMPVVDGIDAAYVVNLAHRGDRMDKFWATHPYLKDVAYREPAVYGNKLKLTGEIAHLFRNNDFKWKKGVIGCALSHYNIWKRLRDSKEVNSNLVLEDDAVLCKDFIHVWRQIAKHVPKDADFIFLGGVLPPNMKALPLVTEPVNTYFARVKKHSLFGGAARRYFHFCTYSYFITKRGAEKLCALIDEKGIFTSIDHMMVNHGDTLFNIYFTTPLLAGCFQDNDPAYKNADFNNFDRVDKFDSEIWNNVECFSDLEVSLLLNRKKQPIVYFENHQPGQCIDSDWLEEIFGAQFVWKDAAAPISGRVFLYYQHTTPVSVIEGWINRHMDCEVYLLHASDEQCTADISIYAHPGIKRVFRNYWRPEAVGPKVVHIPLGYLNGKQGDGNVVPMNERKVSWAFAGAMDRPGRVKIIEDLKRDMPTYLLHTTPTWLSPLNLGSKEYIAQIRSAKFVPCLNGFYNPESYRFYEALEQGAIPLVPLDEAKSYANVLEGSVEPPILGLVDWSTAAAVMKSIGSRPDVLYNIQKELQQWWFGYKLYLQRRLSAITGI